MPQEIPYFTPGASDTPLSASRVNPLVRVANMVLKASGGNGVIVSVSDSNIVIKLDDAFREEIDEKLGAGGGTINFRGEWATSQAYEVGDVVRRAVTSTLADAMQAGTFICIQAHTSGAGNAPPNGNDGGSGADLDNAYWQTLARGRWEHWWSYDDTNATTQARGNVHLNGGDLTIDFGSRTNDGTNNAKLTLDSTVFDTCPDDLKGRVFKPILVDICYEGSAKKMWVLACEPFTPA